jgi:hypothetical protein
MDSTNDTFPMAINVFMSLVDKNKYIMDVTELKDKKIYYVIDMENRNYIIKAICQKPEGEECELKELGSDNLETGRIINNFGGTKWIDVYKWPWSGGKRKSRTQKRKRTKTQKRKRTRTKKNIK